MHTIKHNYLQLASSGQRLSVTRNRTLASGSNQLHLPIDAFDPHSDRMAKQNLNTFNRF
ncbi:hypothetical protein NIES3585_26710 [Nodularia sp. NIES-3585]|nr:hypothetical protein NIES3585_26710 [Nodularia sp. NIES-3585]